MNNKYKNALVTGGAGFIGSHLVERLLKENYQVTVIDDLSEGKWKNLPDHPHLKKYNASILDDVSQFVANQEIIFHLAAIPWPQMSVAEPFRTHRVNIDGTLNILLTARAEKVKKVIFSSSYTVFPKPLVPYSLQKLTGELYCQQFSELWGLETISLRYFNVYGPRMRAEGPYANLLPKFIKLISEDKRPTIKGDGEQKRDFIHVSDVVEANIVAANAPLSGRVFNIKSGTSISVNQVVEIVNRSFGKDVKPLYEPAVVEGKVASASESDEYTLPHWKPKIKFEEGIKTMLI